MKMYTQKKAAVFVQSTIAKKLFEQNIYVDFLATDLKTKS